MISDRWALLTAFLASTFIVAAAFSTPQIFYFELVKASIFIAIGVMLFAGERRFSYLLGIAFPPLWFFADGLAGCLALDFQSLFHYFGGAAADAPMVSPLDGFARVAAICLFIASFFAWKRQKKVPFWGQSFWLCFVISLAYVAVLTSWHLRLFPPGR